jgi:prepilin-type N-terminal cleavage/methylation domain-containing protein
MKLKNSPPVDHRANRAFTLVEVVFAVLILGLLMASLYGGFSYGFTVIQSSREDLRATQILVRRMEALRLYTWSQVLDTNYLSPVFTERYDVLAGTSGAGALYAGVVTTTIPADLPAAYRTNMRAVAITLYWTNYLGKRTIVRTRQMETRVAHNGMQNYVWGAL